ncbi:hypothetical protein [Aeromonas enteropelogenes]|uniref:hypothetical protein n=1 Tax=Aeromonas enteropelogenes TaxID=29489 RepID=UPI001CBFFCE7|nr:hypothetical protein [Aeromonas enteropelogenes]UAK70932.1 hypothetical protein K8O95_14790 [Aeromonas enteropelogenes]
MYLLTPTTELEAVNEILSSIGEAPVNSLESGMDDANMALQILRSVSRETQAIGWYFNREQGFTLSPDEKGEVLVPENTLRLDSGRKDLMLRSGKLYDSKRHTFRIDKPVRVDLVLGLRFNDLPEVARRFITLKAARVFQQRTVSSQSLAPHLAADEQAAWAVLRADEIDAVNTNLFDSPSIKASLQRGFSVGEVGFIGGGNSWVV